MDLVGIDVGYAIARVVPRPVVRRAALAPVAAGRADGAERPPRPQDRAGWYALPAGPPAGPGPARAGRRRRARRGRGRERARRGRCSRPPRRPAGTPRTPEEAEGEVPRADRRLRRRPRSDPPLQGGPQLLLCDAAPLAAQDPGGTAAGFHAAAAARRRARWSSPATPTTVARGGGRRRALLRHARPRRRVGRRRARARQRPDLASSSTRRASRSARASAAPRTSTPGMELGLNHPRGPLAWGDAIGPGACWRPCWRCRRSTARSATAPAPALVRAVRARDRVAYAERRSTLGWVNVLGSCLRRSPRSLRSPAAPAAAGRRARRHGAAPCALPGDVSRRRRAGRPGHVDRRRAAPRGRRRARPRGRRPAGSPAAPGRSPRDRGAALAAALRARGLLDYAEPEPARPPGPARAAPDPLSPQRGGATPSWTRRRPAAGHPDEPADRARRHRPTSSHPEFGRLQHRHARRRALADSHGTATATVAAAPANGVGMLGVWPGMRALNVPLPTGSRSPARTRRAAIARAVARRRRGDQHELRLADPVPRASRSRSRRRSRRGVDPGRRVRQRVREGQPARVPGDPARTC